MMKDKLKKLSVWFLYVTAFAALSIILMVVYSVTEWVFGVSFARLFTVACAAVVLATWFMADCKK